MQSASPARLLSLLFLLVPFAGCTHPAPETPWVGGVEHFCASSEQVANGTIPFYIVGCPVKLGEASLGKSAHTSFAVPANATGLELVLVIETASVGTLHVSVAAGGHTWNLSFVGPYPNDDQMLLVPRERTQATFEYSISVCNIEAADLNADVLGTYGASNATLSAYVPAPPSEGQDFGDPSAATCNGKWAGHPLVPS